MNEIYFFSYDKISQKLESECIKVEKETEDFYYIAKFPTEFTQYKSFSQNRIKKSDLNKVLMSWRGGYCMATTCDGKNEFISGVISMLKKERNVLCEKLNELADCIGKLSELKK